MNNYSDLKIEIKDFTKEKLEFGEYENCVFINCNFLKVNLSEYRFTDCEFINCNMAMIKVADTVFQDIKFIDCKLIGIIFNYCNQFALTISFEKCKISNSVFSTLNLKGIIISDSELIQCDFTGCNLSNGVFDKCDLSMAVFENTNLEKVDFTSSYNYDIDPEKSRMKKAKFSQDGLHGLLSKYDLIVKN